MTDHNAEGGKMVEPCALCGNSTYKIYASGDMIRGCSCFDISDDGDYCVDEWNEMQRRIMAQRRTDFEAGFAAGLRCVGSPAHFDLSWFFNDYLASTRK